MLQYLLLIDVYCKLGQINLKFVGLALRTRLLLITEQNEVGVVAQLVEALLVERSLGIRQ